jgi:hypothetical protein
VSLFVVTTLSATPTEVATLARMTERGWNIRSGKLTTDTGLTYDVIYTHIDPTLRRPVKKRRVDKR